jgi:hypothetical protein
LNFVEVGGFLSYKIIFHEDALGAKTFLLVLGFAFLQPPRALLPSALEPVMLCLDPVHAGVLPPGGAAIYRAILARTSASGLHPT